MWLTALSKVCQGWQGLPGAAHTLASHSKVCQGATKRRWPSFEAFVTLSLPLDIDRQAGFPHSCDFTFTNTEISSDSTDLKPARSFGTELKEGSEKGIKDGS